MRRVVFMLLMVSLFGFVSASVSGGELLWNFESDGSWSASRVSMGDGGGQVFTSNEGYFIYNWLFSSFDGHSNPVPFVENTYGDGEYIIIYLQVDSSKNSDVHATVALEQQNDEYEGDVVIRKYDSGSNLPDWEYRIVIPYLSKNCGPSCQGIKVSDDGEKIFAYGWDPGSGGARYVVLDSNTGQPIKQGIMSISIGIDEFLVSGDFSVAYFRTPIQRYFFDINSGTLITELFAMGQVYSGGSDISSDGSVIVEGNLDNIYGSPKGNYIAILKNNGNGYEISSEIIMPTGLSARGLAITPDGNTLASGATNPFVVGLGGKVMAWDLTNSNSVLIESDYSGDGLDKRNFANEISISDAGEIFAVGLWGNGDWGGPEVMAFDINQNQPIFTADTIGSISAIEISPDGTKIAAAHRSVHAQDFGGGGAIKLYQIGDPEFKMVGVPKAGSEVTFVQPKPAGTVNRVLWSEILDPIMTPYVWLYPDRETLFIVQPGTSDGENSYTRFTLPLEVGKEIYFQGMSFGSQRDLSDMFVKLRVLP